MENITNTSGLPDDNLMPVYQSKTPLSVICERETKAFIATHKNHLLNERSCSISLLAQLSDAIEAENAMRDKNSKLAYLKELPHLSIAMLIAARGDVALVSGGDKSGQKKRHCLLLIKD